MVHKMGKSIVFVVDGDAVIVDSLVAILNHTGIEARGFYVPNDALEKARTATPDLLISDVAMPGMTGIELAILMKSQHPRCKILLFSGQAASAELLGSASLAGHDFQFLTKLIHPTDLLAKTVISELVRSWPH